MDKLIISKENVSNQNLWQYLIDISDYREESFWKAVDHFNDGSDMNKLLSKVSMYTKVGWNTIKSKSRKGPVNEARKLFLFMAYKVLKLGSSVQVGHYVNRDHVTVLANCRKVREHCQTDKHYLHNNREFCRKFYLDFLTEFDREVK